MESVLGFSLWLLFFLTIIIILYKLTIEKEKVYLNPFFYFLVFSFAYLLLPSLFVESINKLYFWDLDNEDIIKSNLLIFFLVSVFLVLFFFSKSKQNIDFKITRLSPIISGVWLLATLYLFYVLIVKIQSDGLGFAQNYVGVKDEYKIKNLAYLMITISLLSYSSKRRLWVFIPNILIVVLDLVEGSRTTAFIALVPVFLAVSIYNKKTYLGLVIAAVLSLSLIGLWRNPTITNEYDVPFHINAIGEFRETYILLPKIIGNKDFAGYGTIEDGVFSVILPFAQPLRSWMLERFTAPGSYAAALVGRGYGLGSNFIVESIFYNDYVFILNIILAICFLTVLCFLIRKSSLVYKLILVSYSIVFIRLIIREGFLSNSSLMVFILIVYMVPFLIINKIKIFGGTKKSIDVFS